jgi:hypothetical protein
MKLLALAILLAACEPSVYHTAINPAPHPMAARPPASVEVFTSSAPTRAHTDVSILHAEAHDFPHPMDDLVESLREDAGKLGCDGVVVVVRRDDGRSLDGTCIVYTN